MESILASDFLPASRFGRPENGIDDGHVAQRILQRHRGLAPFPDGAAEPVSLQGVLVAGGALLDARAEPPGARKSATVVEEDAGDSARRGVEGNLRLHAALRAEKAHALLPRDLR